MEPMDTVSEIIARLKNEGYIVDFNLEWDHPEGKADILRDHPEEFIVDKFYRFEGITDPEDEAIVYALSSDKYDIKGVLVNGYGPNSDSAIDDIVKIIHSKRS